MTAWRSACDGPSRGVMAPMPHSPPMLEFLGVSYSYGARVALKSVEFSVGAGEFCVLLGLNGAGKSTLFSLATGLYVTVTGEIRIHGYDVRRRPVHALRHLGVVFQQRALDPDLSIGENLAYHASLRGMPRRLARERSEQELESAGLLDRMKDKVRALSGGQVRRVEIARALLHRPSVLLLDEPTAGLDVAARLDIRQRVLRLTDDGVAVLWATHLLDEVCAKGRAVVLHHGEVLADGSPADVAADTATEDLAAAFRHLTGSAGATA